MTEQDNGAAETRKSLAEGHGITFPNAKEAIEWLKSGNRMTEQELRESFDGFLTDLEFEIKQYGLIDSVRKSAKATILALIKEAGYKSPEEVADISDTAFRRGQESIEGEL